MESTKRSSEEQQAESSQSSKAIKLSTPDAQLQLIKDIVKLHYAIHESGLLKLKPDVQLIFELTDPEGLTQLWTSSMDPWVKLGRTRNALIALVAQKDYWELSTLPKESGGTYAGSYILEDGSLAVYNGQTAGFRRRSAKHLDRATKGADDRSGTHYEVVQRHKDRMFIRTTRVDPGTIKTAVLMMASKASSQGARYDKAFANVKALSGDEIATSVRATFEVLEIAFFQTMQEPRYAAVFDRYCDVARASWTSLNTREELGYTIRAQPPVLPVALTAEVLGRQVSILMLARALARGFGVRAQNRVHWGFVQVSLTYTTGQVASLTVQKASLDQHIFSRCSATTKDVLRNKLAAGKDVTLKLGMRATEPTERNLFVQGPADVAETLKSFVVTIGVGGVAARVPWEDTKMTYAWCDVGRHLSSELAVAESSPRGWDSSGVQRPDR